MGGDYLRRSSIHIRRRLNGAENRRERHEAKLDAKRKAAYESRGMLTAERTWELFRQAAIEQN